jgi:tetratricopeptide (TPR) repeat protein
MRREVTLLTAALLLSACQRPDEQRTEDLTADQVRQARESLAPGVAAQLDSGNAAYRQRDYDAALRHYQAAVGHDANAAAGWFGIYMAHAALGNQAAADSAMRRAQSLQPGASLIHPTEADTAPAMPRGHP